MVGWLNNDFEITWKKSTAPAFVLRDSAKLPNVWGQPGCRPWIEPCSFRKQVRSTAAIPICSVTPCGMVDGHRHLGEILRSQRQEVQTVTAFSLWRKMPSSTTSNTLKTEASGSSETSVTMYRISQRLIPEDNTLYVKCNINSIPQYEYLYKTSETVKDQRRFIISYMSPYELYELSLDI
jgi:hypothetical protein